MVTKSGQLALISCLFVWVQARQEFLSREALDSTSSDDTSDADSDELTDDKVHICGAQTKVCVADYQAAGGEPVFECNDAVHSAKVDVKSDQSSNGAVVCGQGTFYFSPLSCDQAQDQDFKKTSLVVEDDTWSDGALCPDGGKRVSFPYPMACYFTEC